MSCPLEGNPLVSYQWYFERLLDDSSFSHKIQVLPDIYLNITFLNSNRTLLFREFKEEHNGYYACYAENFLGHNMKYMKEMRVHSK